MIQKQLDFVMYNRLWIRLTGLCRKDHPLGICEIRMYSKPTARFITVFGTSGVVALNGGIPNR